MSNLSNRELGGLKLIEEAVDKTLSASRNKLSPTHSSWKELNRLLELIIPRDLMPTKKVNIIWNSDARTPFIMSMTPSINELYNKSQELNKILNDKRSRSSDFIKKWADIYEWFLEIDTRVITPGDRLCVDNGAQFVAILCHEIGHVMNESPLTLFYNYKKESLRFSTMEKMVLSNSKIIRSIMLPMYVHTLQFILIRRDSEENYSREIYADAYVPDDYKGALSVYIHDKLLHDPDGSRILMDEEMFNNEQKIGIKLSRDSVEMLKGRRNILNSQISAQYNSKDSSKFNKLLMKFIGRKLTGYDPEDDKFITGLKTMMENAYNREYATFEAKSMEEVKRNSRITDRDIDVLAVQISSIKTSDDKLYYIHRLYDIIEGIELQSNGKKDPRLDRLYELRDKIISTNVSDTGAKYGVFVKYPSGYEG